MHLNLRQATNHHQEGEATGRAAAGLSRRRFSCLFPWPQLPRRMERHFEPSDKHLHPPNSVIAAAPKQPKLR
jgi:hypothetical protein